MNGGNKMSSYWLGLTVGFFLGAYTGVLIMALMFIAKREDKRMGIEEG